MKLKVMEKMKLKKMKQNKLKKTTILIKKINLLEENHSLIEN